MDQFLRMLRSALRSYHVTIGDSRPFRKLRISRLMAASKLYVVNSKCLLGDCKRKKIGTDMKRRKRDTQRERQIQIQRQGQVSGWTGRLIGLTHGLGWVGWIGLVRLFHIYGGLGWVRK